MRNPLIWNEKLILAPSLISCCDFCNLEKSIRMIENSGVHVLHIDVIDGHFSPSMPLGLETIKQIRGITDLAFDVHVMSTNNEYFIDELLTIGVEQIIFHLESERHPERLLSTIHRAGVRAGVALNPGTSLAALDYTIHSCDTILLMLINPGFASAGDEQQTCCKREKTMALRRLIETRSPQTLISLDGRVSRADLTDFGPGTANIFVLGSTCLPHGNLPARLEDICRLRTQILSGDKIKS